MVLTDSKKGGGIDSPSQEDNFRINFDNNLRRWFGRNLGEWRSRRQYFFDDEDVLNVEMIIKIEKYVERTPGDLRYRFTWMTEDNSDFFKKKPSYSKEGIIEVSVLGHQLHRNNCYLSESPGVSSIRQVDEHELIFESKYDRWYVLEHTRLIDQDRYRSRVIYSWNSDKLRIVENHHEIRIHDALGLIEDDL
ncbi:MULTISPECIES: hypothetical protein [Prochlorococcus]|uniref:hypothetical protein n=1 Tax=Prochlorococcus TaxID=1218 RepID=UPI000533A12A|nr:MULTISPECIES: hypothetical protein [Prochlorococcus]KGG12238.1 hypothetical protein EV05_1447 [Prochlorococcus sp. MIT 0601]